MTQTHFFFISRDLLENNDGKRVHIIENMEEYNCNRVNQNDRVKRIPEPLQ